MISLLFHYIRRSEANDLAIQMARLYTGGYDVVSVERSFHGGLSVPNLVSLRQFTNERKLLLLREIMYVSRNSS